MTKRNNTFEKRRRDMEKKLRAEDKRRKKQVRKSAEPGPPAVPHDLRENPEADAG